MINAIYQLLIILIIKEKANKLNKSNHASKGFHFSENINNLYNKKLNIQIFAKPR